MARDSGDGIVRAQETVTGDFDAAVASLRRMGLIAAREIPVLTPLAGGVSSLIVRVDSTRATFCFKQALPQLKVAAEWFAPVARNRAEVAWLRLANTILPGIAPDVLGEDADANAFAMAYLDTSVYPVWKQQLQAGTIAVSTAAAVGKALVAIHAATAGRASIASAFSHAGQFADLRIDPYLLATARVHSDLAPALQSIAATTGSVKLTLVHGDIAPKNILVGGVRGIVFLDAECADYGDPAFDLTFCLNHLLLKAAAQPSRAFDFHATFSSLSDAYRAGLAWEPFDVFERRAVPLLSALLLARIDGKSPVEYLDDTARRRVRAFARRGVAAPFASLAELGRAWYGELHGE